ncbi:MAG: hypothetical protein EXS18_04365 [Verrucomicrobiae bacterium]|nr:hypothetical protein [Verrucomicrobiae bacterium]
MNLYAADNQLDDQQVSLRAGLLVANTNFNREYGFYKGQTNRCGQHECNNWRFSRDGLFPSCAAASHQEALSYAGWNPPFEHPLASMPILWELEACHDGQRHVLFSNWKIQLMSDGQFHSLTNEFVQRMSALRQKH